MSRKVELDIRYVIAAVAVTVGLLLGFLAAYMLVPEEGAVPRAYQTKFYITSGGDKAVVGDGGELEILSGGSLDLQSGASITGTAGFDLNGGTLTWDADADTTSVSSDDDVISTTIGTSAGAFKILEPDGTERFRVDGYGQVVFTPEADETTGNYDEWVTITGDMTGTGTKDRNYGLLIEMTRPAGQELSSGDHDEAAMKIRIDTEAITTTAGTVLRAIDAEAKADNPSGTVTNLYGASVTAKSDTGAGDVAQMIALTTNTQNNSPVTDLSLSADFRLFRISSTEPTIEGVVRVRNGSQAGTGVDYGISIESDYSGETDDFNYGIDMSGADIDNGDIRFQNGTVLEETVDTVLTFSEFLAAEEQTAEVVTEGSTIVPTGTYQPISSASAVTTSTSTAIANGTQIGQLLILVNENASDTITVDDGANTRLSGNAVLGNDDSLMLIWDGADWLEIAQADTT